MKKKKILLIKLSSLGDVIFNIPLANALKDAGYEVTWLVSEKGIDVVKNNPCVDNAVLAPVVEWKKRGPSIKSFLEYLEILGRLKAEKFDVAIDSQMMLKSMYWMLFCGAKRKITSKEGREMSPFAANEIIDNISSDPKSPIVMNYLRFANHLGINVRPEDIKITLPERSKEQIQKIDDLLSEFSGNKPLIAIAPATTWENKHWNRDNWRKVVEYLINDYNIVFTGGPKDRELIEYISQGKGLNLAGKTNLLELAELFSRCELVMAPDSGSAHLAWASKNPKVIAIFTCTPKEVLGPLGFSDKYISLGGSGLPCQPCFRRKCLLKENKNACTYYPTAQEVIEAIKKLLQIQ